MSNILDEKEVWLSEDNMYICEVCTPDLQNTCQFMNKCVDNCKLLKSYLHKLQQNDIGSSSSKELCVTMSDCRKYECNKKNCSTTENWSGVTEEFTPDNIKSEVYVKQESEIFCDIQEYSQFCNINMESMSCNADECNVKSEIDVKNHELDVINSAINSSAENLSVNISSGTDSNFADIQGKCEFRAEDSTFGRIHWELDIKSESDIQMDQMEINMTEEIENLTLIMDVVPSNTVGETHNYTLHTDIEHRELPLSTDVEHKEKTKCINRLRDEAQKFNDSVMLHERKYVHKCTVCERMFKTACTLRHHMQTHKEKKRNKCAFCDKD